MNVWAKDSSIIDTPGIRSLDVSSFQPYEIQDYFQEFTNYKRECKYADCLHYHEQITACKIKQEVMRRNIRKERYESYLRIMSDLLNRDQNEEILKEMRDYYEN